MREYARISPKFWIGETGVAIRGLGAPSQLVAIYLLTSPHSNMIGMYWQPISYMAEEVGITIQGAEKALAGLIELNFCVYDQHTKVVWVKEMAKFQIADKLSPKDKQAKGVQNAYDEVPANPFLEDFYSAYSEAFCMEHARSYEGPSKILGSKAQAQEKAKAQAKAQAEEPADAVVSLPLVGGEQHAVVQERIDFWSNLYPAVDVLQELRKMAGWCDAKSERRKTPRGIEAFITNWLAKAQDQGGSPAVLQNGRRGGALPSVRPGDIGRIPDA